MSEYRFNSFIAHEAVTAQLGDKAGGAAGVAYEHAHFVPGGRVVAPRNGHLPQIPHHVFEPPIGVTNDELAGILTQPDHLDRFARIFNGEVNEGHYYVAGEVLKALGKLHIYMGHSWDRVVEVMDHSRRKTPQRARAEIGILQQAKALVVSTEAERIGLATRYAEDSGLSPEQIAKKTHVVPLGIDHHRFNIGDMQRIRPQVRNQYLAPDQAQEGNVAFFTLGRMSKQKGHLEAVRAVGDLLTQEDNLPISLSVIGGPTTGEYFDEIMDYYQGLAPDVRRRIHFHGALPAEHAHAMGDVLLGPSTWETWFLSMSEAMACGRPVVVSDIPEMPILNQVAGHSGIFLPREDTLRWSQTIRELALSPQMRDDIGRANMQTALGYTWERTGEKLEQVIQSIQ